MVRIAHFGDTHIKNLKYHYEYRKAFEEIYNTLREQNVDYICLLYTSPSPRDYAASRMPSSA